MTSTISRSSTSSPSVPRKRRLVASATTNEVSWGCWRYTNATSSNVTPPLPTACGGTWVARMSWGSASASSLTSTPKNLDSFAARRRRVWNSDGAGDDGGAVAGRSSGGVIKFENGGGVRGTGTSGDDGTRDVRFGWEDGPVLGRTDLRLGTGRGLRMGTADTGDESTISSSWGFGGSCCSASSLACSVRTRPDTSDDVVTTEI